MAGNRETDPHLTGANGSGPLGRDRPPDPSTAGAQSGVDLQDKVALIVDGATADSQALTLALARRGMHVVLLYFHDEHRSTAAIKEQVEAQERRCLLLSCTDLSDAPSEKQLAEHAMQEIRETFGRLDVFVNLSTSPRSPNGDGRPAARKRSLRSRLFPHLKITKAALNQIVESDPDR